MLVFLSGEVFCLALTSPLTLKIIVGSDEDSQEREVIGELEKIAVEGKIPE